MANFFFETMTQAQATAFSSAGGPGVADQIVFSSGGANQASVGFNPLTLSGPPTITLTYGGNSLIFADSTTSLRGATLTLFNDGSHLFIGNATADNPINGTAGADGLFGSGGDDSMNGLAGADLLQGNQGDDTLTGGNGFDTIFGGQGDDSIDVGAGGTGNVNFANGNLGDDTISGGSGSLGDGSNTATDMGAGGSTYTGGSGVDTITTGAGADNLSTGAGDDSINSGGGADTISAGSGNDTIDAGGGGAAHDVLSLGGGVDKVIIAAGSSLAATATATVISDWVLGDTLKFAAIGTGAGFYHNDTNTAASFSAAITEAETWRGTHVGDKYFAVQVGADIVVFADSNGDAHITAADDAVLLTGRALSDITGTSFI